MSEYTTRQILDMIEANGGPVRLDLSGKDLSGIDLSRDTIQVELGRVREDDPEAEPAWVGGAANGVSLLAANLQGADLTRANLQGADLRVAKLRGARLERANLQDSILRGVKFQRADLWGADLRGADLEVADLREANLARANLRGAYLARANLQGANLMRANLQGATLTRADLQGAYLVEAYLQEACLATANLQQAILWQANLQGANLRGVNFQEVSLWGDDFQRAYLEGDDLTRVNLLNTESIERISLYRALLDNTQLTKDQLGGAIGEELRGEWFEAKEAYLALKNNFEQIGRYDDAAWAYRKERRMEKLEALQRAKAAFQKRDWREAAQNYAKVAGDQLVELVCDYGESIGRVLGTMVAVWLLFALVYDLIAGVWGPWQDTATGQVRHIVRNPIDLLSFSLGAMTTLTPADLEARSMLAMRILIPLEAMLGIALAGLLGFVAGNRIRRS